MINDISLPGITADSFKDIDKKSRKKSRKKNKKKKTRELWSDEYSDYQYIYKKHSTQSKKSSRKK
jgi:hypothetical protein